MKRNFTVNKIVFKHLIACLAICLLVLVTAGKSLAQVTGDFRSISSAGWNVSTTWERYSSTAVWEPSGTGENSAGLTPNAANAVFIQSGYTVTLIQNEACNDLHLANGTTAALGTRGIVDVASFTLAVNGKLRAYFATVGTVPGTASTGGYSAYPFLATTGKISIVGNSRTVLAATDWGATVTTSSANFPLEVNLNSGQTAIFATNIKVSSFNFVSGTVDGQSYSMDNGAGAGFGDATIGSGATVISQGSGTAVFQRTGTTLAGTLTVNGTLRLTGAAPVFRMTNINLNGTVEYSANIQALAVSGSGGANPVTYNNLTIGGSSSAVKTTAPGFVTTVNGKLLMNGSGGASIAFGAGGSLVYGATATLEYQTSSSRVVGTEWPATGGPFNVSITSASSVSFAASSSTNRTIAGTFTLGGGNFTVNTGNTLTFANGANIIRNVGQLNLTGGAVLHGLTTSDLVNLTINVTSNSSGEISSNVTPGKIGTLTIGAGISYTNTGGRTVTNLVNNGIVVLTPTTTLTLTVSGTISGSGSITSNLSTANPINYNSSSLAFTGTAAAGTLLMTPGFNVIRNLTLNNPGGLILGNALKVDTTLNLTAGTLTTGGNLSLGNGTGIVRTTGSLSAAPVFGTSVNLTYNDAIAATTGFEMPASSSILNNLTNNNTNGVLLGNSATVNGSLSLNAGFLAIGSNTLTLNGAVSGAGTLSATTASNLVIAAAAGILNFTVGANALNNFTLTSGSAALGTALDMYGVLTVSAGTLDLASQNLTLRSTATSTARVAPIGGILTAATANNVTVERYLANPQRAWHLLSAQAVTGTQNIFDSWQNAGVLSANKGTLITSNLYSGSNGFDATSNSASILTHNQAGGGAWDYNLAATNGLTAAAILSSRQGYMLFVRGDRNYNTGNAPATSPIVLSAKGQLTQGAVNVTVSSAGAGNTLVGNPYASPVDMEKIMATGLVNTPNLDQNYMVWDPALAGNNSVGGFRAVVRTGVNAYNQTPVVLGGTVTNDATIQFIPSGSAFFIHATGADAILAFTEATKAITPTIVYNPIVATAGDQQILANLMVVQPDNTALLADGIRIMYNDGYKATTADDIIKMGNFTENLSSYRDGKKLIVEKRPMIGAKDTIFLRMTNTTVKNYRFQVGTIDFVQTHVTAYLEDTYKGSKTALDLTGAVNNIDFSVTTDAASASQDRFRIVFEGKTIQPQTSTSIKASEVAVGSGQTAAIAVDWKVSNQYNMKEYELEKSADGINYTKVNTQDAMGANGSDVSYSWLDVKPVVGNNYYRVRSTGIAGDVDISQAVVVKIAKGNPAVTVYPNPVTNRTLNLQFTDMEKGIYQLRLLNTVSQVVFAKAVNHNGGSATQKVVFDHSIAKGAYQLEIIKPGNTKTTMAILITE